MCQLLLYFLIGSLTRNAYSDKFFNVYHDFNMTNVKEKISRTLFNQFIFAACYRLLTIFELRVSYSFAIFHTFTKIDLPDNNIKRCQ